MTDLVIAPTTTPTATFPDFKCHGCPDMLTGDQCAACPPTPEPVETTLPTDVTAWWEFIEITSDTRCPDCDGEGRINGRRCPTCKGWGVKNGGVL